MSSSIEPTVMTRRQGRIGRITLNRPKALNAIDGEMIRTIRAALEHWREDPAVHAIVIEGAGSRAFCAGGDIRWLRDRCIAEDYTEVDAFFAEEYALNLTIARYPKPFAAFINGVCMGGGIGLAVHGSIRVVSDAASLAMPETSIGFFPDVGASFILPRLRPGFGMLMGLTGVRMNGADAAYLGLATHYVPSERFASLADEIADDGLGALMLAAVAPPSSRMSGIAARVHCFEGNSVREVLGSLAALEGDWAQETLATLRTVSPSALLWSFDLLRRGASQTLEQCLATELALSRSVSRHPDFLEGVRAMVVDKDREPHWSPRQFDDVDIKAIAKLFA